MENMIASSYNRNTDPGTQLRQSMRELGDRLDAMVSPPGKTELKRIRFDNNVTIKYKKKPEPTASRSVKKQSQADDKSRKGKSKAFINPIVM